MIRVLAGLGIVGAGFIYQSWWGAVGVVPLLTAAIGWCPPCSLLGISTSGARGESAKPA